MFYLYLKEGILLFWEKKKKDIGKAFMTALDLNVRCG